MYDPLDPKNIATTIKQQIGMSTLMCIGAHNVMALPRDDANNQLGGLKFKINPNPKLKVHATVTIILNGNDTYSVKIITCRGKEVLNISNVYCEDLAGPNGVIERVTG